MLKKVTDFLLKIRGFLTVNKKSIFDILMIYKPSLVTFKFPHKIWARSVQPFGYKQTNNLTPKTDKQIIDTQTNRLG